MTARPVSVLLVDDHEIVRKGLRAVLEGAGRFSIVGEAGGGAAALRLVETLKPDVMVLDLMMPGEGGLQVLRELSERAIRPAVVVLTMHAGEAYIAGALRLGALGYVLKDSDSAEVVQAIVAAAAGERYLSSSLSPEAVERYNAALRASVADPLEMLTRREREVVDLTVQGHTSTRIGEQLGISPRTAEVHRASAMKKLGFNKQQELVRYMLEREAAGSSV